MQTTRSNRVLPARAQQIEIFLDVLLQLLNVLEALARVFGLDLSNLFGGGGGK